MQPIQSAPEAEQTPILAERKGCDAQGAGLSHFILMEPQQQQEKK